METEKKNRMIYAVYQDENDNIHIGISPEFSSYLNNEEYFINLGDSLLKTTFEKINKFKSENDVEEKDGN